MTFIAPSDSKGQLETRYKTGGGFAQDHEIPGSSSGGDFEVRASNGILSHLRGSPSMENADGPPRRFRLQEGIDAIIIFSKNFFTRRSSRGRGFNEGYGARTRHQ